MPTNDEIDILIQHTPSLPEVMVNAVCYMHHGFAVVNANGFQSMLISHFYMLGLRVIVTESISWACPELTSTE